MEIVLWLFVGAWLVSAFYALAENLSNRHVLTRGVGAKVRLAWGAVIWLPVTLWSELAHFFSQEWRLAQVRYTEVPA